MSEERPETRGGRQAHEARLARALRENLKKRRTQERSRGRGVDDPSPADGGDLGRSG